MVAAELDALFALFLAILLSFVAGKLHDRMDNRAASWLFSHDVFSRDVLPRDVLPLIARHRGVVYGIASPDEASSFGIPLSAHLGISISDPHLRRRIEACCLRKTFVCVVCLTAGRHRQHRQCG